MLKIILLHTTIWLQAIYQISCKQINDAPSRWLRHRLVAEHTLAILFCIRLRIFSWTFNVCSCSVRKHAALSVVSQIAITSTYTQSDRRSWQSTEHAHGVSRSLPTVRLPQQLAARSAACWTPRTGRDPAGRPRSIAPPWSRVGEPTVTNVRSSPLQRVAPSTGGD